MGDKGLADDEWLVRNGHKFTENETFIFSERVSIKLDVNPHFGLIEKARLEAYEEITGKVSQY